MNLQIALICKVEKKIVSNGCKMVRYSKIGRNIFDMRQTQFQLLNMKSVLGMFPTSDEVYQMSCYFDQHFLTL